MANQQKAEFFDGQVLEPWAAAEYGPNERPKLERLLDQAQLRPGQRVLEPGCGTGRLTHLLAQAVGPAGQVVALDISPRMLAACQERVAGLPQVELRPQALEEYGPQPLRFDLVMCHQVFPHFDDQARALEIMAHSLRIGGVLLVVHFINLWEINDTHRKAGTAIAGDLLPPSDQMARLVSRAGLVLEQLADDGLGYLLRARRIGLAGCATAAQP